MEDQLKALETEAMGEIEASVEQLAGKLVEIGKKVGDLEIENASPLVKIIYAATKEQLVSALKAMIEKLDLNHDGK